MSDAAATFDDDRPADGVIFIEGDNLPEVADAVNRLLKDSNSGVYQRGDVVVGLVDDAELRERERPYRIVTLDADSLAQRANRHAGGGIYQRNLKTGKLRRTNLPPWIARTIIAEKKFAYPELVAVAEAPILTPQGVLLDAPGYAQHEGLLLVFDPSLYERERLTRAKTPDDVDWARVHIQELLSGFPFESAVDESVAIAMLMTAVYRPALPAAPAFAISARAPGTGKTHLQRMASWIATGRESGLISWPGDEQELRKALLAELIVAGGHLPIDNVNGVLRSDALCVLLTAPVFTQRMLGGNESVTVPTRCLVSVNGNNLQVAGDLVRRFLVCRLDAGVERPEARSFKFDPIDRLRLRRQDYVEAVLTITQAYLRSGDRAKLAPFAGFGAWSRLVREPLVWAGIADPVASVEIAAKLDPDRQQLEAMVLAVAAMVGDRMFDVAQLVSTAKAHVLEDDDSRQQRQALRQAIEDIALRGSEISNKALGRWLASIEGRIALGRRFVRARDKGEAGLRWRLEQFDGA